MKKSGETLKEVLSYIGKYRILLPVSLFFAAAGVILSLYLPIMFGKAVDQIAGKGEVNFSELARTLFFCAILAAAAAVSQWLMNTINQHITFHVVRDLRNEAFRKMEHMPLAFLDSHPHGDIVSRIITDADQFSDGLLMGFTSLFTGVITILGTLFFMFAIHPLIAGIVVVLTPLSLIAAHYIATGTYSMFKLQSEMRAKQTELIDEAISGQGTVKAYGKEAKMISDFDKINEALEKASLKAIFFSSVTNPVTRFVNNIVYAAVGITGAFLAIRGQITVGGLSGFLAYANGYTKPFNEISGVITEFQNAIACAGRILELIHKETECYDGDLPPLKKPEGRVEISDVSFSYDKKRRFIEHLNLFVKAGERVAIVGPTGCGKSTVINLLMRFYDVDEGYISVDEREIRTVTRKSLRSSYGMVLQETWLKKGSIRENIATGKPDASLEEIMEAAKASHAHGFIMKLKDGYDTLIDEDGAGLSGGQRQLLCIARVMLALPPMLVLDEATSSIDTRTEAKIQNAFRRMMKGRTSFIVAHRLQTIREADIILVMKDGNIIEKGKHEELLLKKGFYHELYHSQFSV